MDSHKHGRLIAIRYIYTVLGLCLFVSSEPVIGRLLSAETVGNGTKKRALSTVAPQLTKTSLSPHSAKANKFNPTSQENVRLFGEHHLEPIENDNCILFLGGAYIEAPYHVSQKGLGIYVNDYLVKQYEWPGTYFLANDPSPPKGLNRNSSFADLAKGYPPETNWAVLKSRFLYSHFSPDEARQKYVEAYRELPFVKTATIERDQDLGCPLFKAIAFNGDVQSGTMEISRDMRPPAPERVIKRLEDDVDAWGESLREGGFIWGKKMFRRPSKEWYTIPELVEIISSEDSAAEKSKHLSPFFNKHISDPIELKEVEARRAVILSNFRANAQLDVRVKAILKERRMAREEERKRKARQTPPAGDFR